MTRIVEAVHPVPTSYVPRRAKLSRLALVQARTPVELVRIGPDAVGPRMPIRHGRRTELGFHAIEGRLFLRVDEPLSGRGVADLLADLSRDAGVARRTLLDMAIARTPLSAQLDAMDANGRPTADRTADHRGVPVEWLGPHEAETDNLDEARAALRDWFSGNVRLAGDGLYVDTGGPLLRPVRKGATAEYDTVPFPRLAMDRLQCPRGPFTQAEALDYRRRSVRSYHASPTPEHFEIVSDPLPPEAEAGRDTDTLFANMAPGFVLDAMGAAMRTAAGAAALEWDGVPLRRMAMLGTMGLNPPSAVASICRRVDQVARGGIGIPAVGRVHGEALNLVRNHVSDWIEPRLRERADRILDEDAPDLAALVP